MKKILRNSAPFLLAMVLPSLVFAGDLKYTQRIIYGDGPAHDTVYYVTGERQRIDSQSYFGGQTPESLVYGPHTAMIMQCDLNRVLLLNLDTRKYFVHQIKQGNSRGETGKLSAVPPLRSKAANKNPTEERAVAVQETGDKRDFHNREAWLVRLTIESTTHYEGVTHKSTSVDESWYIDLDVPMYCRKQMGLKPNTGAQYRLSTGDENVTETRTGTARIGFPISRNYRVTSSSESRQSSMEIVDWSEEPLDPKLFEVPGDFVETKNSDDINPRFGSVSKPNGAWENFLQWMKHFFRTP
jgi:hypothetical protein